MEERKTKIKVFALFWLERNLSSQSDILKKTVILLLGQLKDLQYCYFPFVKGTAQL